MLTAGIAVVVIGAIVGIGVGVKSSSASSSAAAFVAPAGAVIDPEVNAQTHTNDPTAILYGSPNAKVTMTVYEDVRCPFCDIFEVGANSVYKKYVDAGEVKVMFHEVKLIDVNDQAAGEDASGSRNGGSALACAQNASLFDQYHDVLFDNQPDETTDTWSRPLRADQPGDEGPRTRHAHLRVLCQERDVRRLRRPELVGLQHTQVRGHADGRDQRHGVDRRELFSASSTAGVTANTALRREGANITASGRRCRAAVSKAYGTTTPAPWASAWARPSAAAGSASASGSATASASTSVSASSAS